MKTPDINALRRKQNSNSLSSSANTNVITNTAVTTNDSDDDGFLWFVLVVYLYLVPSMIWTSLEYGFDYKLKDFLTNVFIPFKYIKLDEYWMAAGIVVGNIVASIILLMMLGMLSETIDNGVWDTEMEFDGKVVFFYILIFAGFFIVPLTRPW